MRTRGMQILVSHANAEDLGIVLGFWTYMSDALQVDVFAYECALRPAWRHAGEERPPPRTRPSPTCWHTPRRFGLRPLYGHAERG